MTMYILINVKLKVDKNLVQTIEFFTHISSHVQCKKNNEKYLTHI